uniref:uncharacterized protein LOC120835185 isoform X1 n=1 Tax=Gasterosteus aculeatus aculeatus TaxID=481459 RepID=UPI001A98658C|nr:uncharacterized protein LOC120835185 isoform X1 [Gasterosteus aculeatus aculeatus]
MAGRLLFVTLMYSCANTKTQARPQLIMNSAVISETETVTLDCRAPSYPTVHQCYFTIIGAKHAKGFTCVQTLTGTELLRMSDQRAPAEVKVDCYYTVMVGDVNHPSAHSVTSSITIQNVVKSSTTQTKTASAVTTAGLCASRPVTTIKQTSADQTFGPRNSGSFSSPPLTTDKPTSEMQRWMFMVIAICLGGFFSISLLGLGLLCRKRTLGKNLTYVSEIIELFFAPCCLMN